MDIVNVCCWHKICTCHWPILHRLATIRQAEDRQTTAKIAIGIGRQCTFAYEQEKPTNCGTKVADVLANVLADKF